jgi:RES domain-containing protein
LPLDVDAAVITGRWLRHARPGSAALPQHVPPPDNRWQRGEVVQALYLADEADTAWAEWYRHLAEAGIPPARSLPRALWTWSVDATVADFSTDQQLERVGLGFPRPGRRGWPAFQAVGEQLGAEGWAGLVAPSAARPSHRVLCLFRTGPDGRAGPSGARPVGRPRRVLDPPIPPTGMTT